VNEEIIYTNDTLAHRIGNKIYLHEDLKHNQYIHLHKALLQHELDHVDAITFKDLLLDLKQPGIPQDELRTFRRNHRDIALRMMSPINRFGVNYNLILVYIIMVALVYSVMRGTLWIASLL
jgi:hypothetical protein